MRPKIVLLSATLLAACGQQGGGPTNANNAPASEPAHEAAVPPPGTGPDARTPLAEPKDAIDPKSIEAAGQVVQHYGALIEQRRLAEAANLWSDSKTAADFARQLNPDVHLEIGKLGNSEGAAGSIYTTVPVVFYGNTFRKPAEIILRRVNDVPGSTEEQRRWHIERIDWKAAP